MPTSATTRSTRATRFCRRQRRSRDERTLQSGFGVGGPIVRNRAHFYFTLEHDSEQIAGFKRFPPAAAPLATDMLGEFSVDANNYFAPRRSADQQQQLRERPLAARNGADQG